MDRIQKLLQLREKSATPNLNPKQETNLRISQISKSIFSNKINTSKLYHLELLVLKGQGRRSNWKKLQKSVRFSAQASPKRPGLKKLPFGVHSDYNQFPNFIQNCIQRAESTEPHSASPSLKRTLNNKKKFNDFCARKFIFDSRAGELICRKQTSVIKAYQADCYRWKRHLQTFNPIQNEKKWKRRIKESMQKAQKESPDMISLANQYASFQYNKTK